jgi:hypothetical protein
MATLIIKRKEFVHFLLNDADDKRRFVDNYVVNQLVNNEPIDVSINELVKGCGYIPHNCILDYTAIPVALRNEVDGEYFEVDPTQFDAIITVKE